MDRERTHGALAVASRLRLLDALRASERPLDAQELAAACDLHLNTVRFHLQVLDGAGLVRSRAAPIGTRGRPRLLYSPTTTGARPGGYQLLAAVLAAHWSGSPAQRARRAESAGRALAAEQGFTPPAPGAAGSADALEQVAGLFAELGFEPEVVDDGSDLRLLLHACPFRAVAAEHPEVVCSMHLGLLRGSLDELGAPLTASSLEPFVEPHLCVARLDLARASGEIGP